MTSTAADIPNKGLTHAGVFHADDVFATALLRILNPIIEIVRSNTVPAGFAGIVYDIGGGEFDHHQVGAPVRENGVPYAAFGLVWATFGTRLLREDSAASFDEGFIQPMDLADNTGLHNPLSQCVSDFNLRRVGANELEYDAAFWKAVAWAQGVLDRRLASLQYADEARDYVRAAMNGGDGAILVLGRIVPWKAEVVGSGYKYVVYPSLRGGFNVQCVPKRLGDGSMVRPFPKAWRGLRGEEMRTVTGVVDATFCHINGYLCVAASLEGALELACLSLTDNSHTD